MAYKMMKLCVNGNFEEHEVYIPDEELVFVEPTDDIPDNEALAIIEGATV